MDNLNFVDESSEIETEIPKTLEKKKSPEEKALDHFFERIAFWAFQKAYRTSEKGENIVVAIDTSWMGRIEKGYIQKLTSRLERLRRTQGLENVIFVVENGKDLSEQISKEIEGSDRNTPLENIIIFSEESLIKAGLFDDFETNNSKKSAFIVRIVKPREMKVTQYLIVDFVQLIPRVMDIALSNEKTIREYVLDLDPVDQDMLNTMGQRYLLYERQYETSL